MRDAERQEANPFYVSPAPLRAAEHDVDTALHLLLGRLGSADVFEGLCNPPGGDWSGLSVMTEDRKEELRWLVLPRVTADGAKRPDHVFHLFGSFKPSIVLAIESKEKAQAVEPRIGPRLVKYVNDLINGLPSVRRESGGDWKHCEDRVREPMTVASGAAFVMQDEGAIGAVAGRAEVDIVLGFRFSEGRDSCEMLVSPCTDLGKEVALFISSLDVKGLALKVVLSRS